MDSLTRTADGKADFANRARAFANRAAKTPAFPMFELICLAVAALAVIAGAFGTINLPLPQRAAFWLALMGWNVGMNAGSTGAAELSGITWAGGCGSRGWCATTLIGRALPRSARCC